MKLVSWNVNGIRACLKKGFLAYVEEQDADIIAIQETKCQVEQVNIDLPGYYQYWHQAEKKGYSGTAVFTKREPLAVTYGIDGAADNEGRVITLEFDDCYVVNAYVPNAQRTLARLPFRLQWEDEIHAYLCVLDKRKPVMYCGDLNVAHTANDIKNAKANEGNSGCTVEERAKFSTLLASGFVDTFRQLHPNETDSYTWWSYMANVRARNIGWRIDYVLVSARLMPHITSAGMHTDVLGSDHCPIYVTKS